MHLQERIGVLESTLRAEREERHAERLAEARRAEALQRRVDTLAGEAEAANKDPVSGDCCGVPLGSAGRFSHRSMSFMRCTWMLNLGQRWAVGPSGRLRHQWRAQACAALRGIGDDLAAGQRRVCAAGGTIWYKCHTTYTYKFHTACNIKLQRLGEFARLEARMAEMEQRHQARQHELQVCLPFPPYPAAVAFT